MNLHDMNQYVKIALSCMLGVVMLICVFGLYHEITFKINVGPVFRHKHNAVIYAVGLAGATALMLVLRGVS